MCIRDRFEIALDYTFYDEAYPENDLDNILKDDPLKMCIRDSFYDI